MEDATSVYSIVCIVYLKRVCEIEVTAGPVIVSIVSVRNLVGVYASLSPVNGKL